MATRTPKGTVSTKTDSTTLVLSSISCTIGDALIVMIGNQTANVPSSVTWGARELTLSRQRTNTTSALVGSIWIARNIANTDTRNITATWDVSIGTKAMAASILDAGHVRDNYVTAVQTDSTAPSTGATAAQTELDDFAIGILVSEGPDSDIAPTLDTGWTAGQRIGTAGVPPVSNITLLEGYQQLTDSSAVTLSGTGATSRDWANLLITYRPIRLAVPMDVNANEILVDDTVEYGLDGLTSTVSSLTSTRGSPFVKVTLANGLVYNAHTLQVIG